MAAAYPAYWETNGFYQRIRNYQPPQEHSHYALHALALWDRFPPHERFVIRVQSRLIPLAHHFATKSSRRDSRGAKVTRKLKRAKTPDIEVDFVTDSGILIPVLICDSKATWKNLPDDEDQIKGYQTRLTHGPQRYYAYDEDMKRYEHLLKPVRGLLLCAAQSRLYAANGESCILAGDISDWNSALCQELANIRREFNVHLPQPIPPPVAVGALPYWFHDWIDTFSEDDAIAEGSVYAPAFYVFLAKYPPNFGNLIKPQAVLSGMAPNDQWVKHWRKSSLGANVYTAWDEILHFVDFLIVRTTGMVNGVPNDTVICACEMKRPDAEPGMSLRQALFIQTCNVLNTLYAHTGKAYPGLSIFGLKVWVVLPKTQNGRLVLDANSQPTYNEPDFTVGAQNFCDLNAPFWNVVDQWQPLPGP